MRYPSFFVVSQHPRQDWVDRHPEWIFFWKKNPRSAATYRDPGRVVCPSFFVVPKNIDAEDFMSMANSCDDCGGKSSEFVGYETLKMQPVYGDRGTEIVRALTGVPICRKCYFGSQPEGYRSIFERREKASLSIDQARGAPKGPIRVQNRAADAVGIRELPSQDDDRKRRKIGIPDRMDLIEDKETVIQKKRCWV